MIVTLESPWSLLIVHTKMTKLRQQFSGRHCIGLTQCCTNYNPFVQVFKSLGHAWRNRTLGWGKKNKKQNKPPLIMSRLLKNSLCIISWNQAVSGASHQLAKLHSMTTCLSLDHWLWLQPHSRSWRADLHEGATSFTACSLARGCHRDAHPSPAMQPLLKFYNSIICIYSKQNVRNVDLTLSLRDVRY